MKMIPHALAFLAFTAAAQTQQAPAEQARKEAASRAPFVFEAGEIELTELIRRCGTYLQRNILVDESELGRQQAAPRGRGARAAAPPAEADAADGPVVSLDQPVVTDRDGCEELLTSLLWRHGLVVVPLDADKGVYEVLSMNGPRQREIVQRAVHRAPVEVLQRPTLREFVTVVHELQHTNAMQATNALRPFFSVAGNHVGQLVVCNMGNSRAIVLSGPQNMVADALLLLKAADVPEPPAIDPPLEARLDALAQQNAKLLERIAALEKKVAGG